MLLHCEWWSSPACPQGVFRVLCLNNTDHTINLKKPTTWKTAHYLPLRINLRMSLHSVWSHIYGFMTRYQEVFHLTFPVSYFEIKEGNVASSEEFFWKAFLSCLSTRSERYLCGHRVTWLVLTLLNACLVFGVSYYVNIVKARIPY